MLFCSSAEEEGSSYEWTMWNGLHEEKKPSWWQAEELLEEIELQESELGILGRCIYTESSSHTYSLQPCPFCPYFVVFFSVKSWTTFFTCGRESWLLDLKRSWEPCAPVSCVFEVFVELNFVLGINFSQKPSDAFYFLLVEDMCCRLLYVSLNYFPNG